ncbi:arginine:agmatin antiporter [Yersinia pseudotuberculosis]|uniref:arginine/agmatine antiporter n=1 Tax=Yersinia pseudotuberculosis TaxID=633 RepID=UPI0005769FE6|nr:arginine/agmatine antiporter [Yersinia pseudotuberculosis]QES97710.1 arginine/agmatine antiporter [Yersinia pseudotuberculosis]CFU98774.1 arginine:agmatin antiporter [Yersinia pseudotuberculosis]CNC21884.1 arginine:agmatin antiporter [Yersinia pseudotuberculosis]CNC37256.1 arginine:agmatin antiporter [Yersinia pseudotuberculosis]CND65820.1 arginine:agmatin antiporter [Yersinia pseudotuberculosis]
MSTDDQKVGLIPVTLMVAGNIMGSGVFLLPANLASTGGIAIWGWLVTIIGALALSMVYAKMSSLDDSPGGAYAYARRAFGPFLGYQTNVLYWLACWIGNIAMVVIGVGYLSYFFPILKEPMVLTITCVVFLWIFVGLNIIGPKMITRVQAVATSLALIPIVGIALFGWFWFKGETYMAAWNVSGLGTFGAIQSTLNVTLWSFIGVETASVAAGVVKNPKRNVPIATVGGVLIAAVCYVLSSSAIMGMIPNAELRLSASPFGDAARLALGDTAGAVVSLCAAAGCLGSLGGWTLVAGQTAKAAADDGLFPPIFGKVNKAGTPVAGLLILGVLMTIFQISSISPNAAKEFGLVSSVSVIFTLVPYLYTCSALLLVGHGHLGNQVKTYVGITLIAFVYCIWAVVGSGAEEVMWSFVTLMVITALYTFNYNRTHKNPFPLDAPVKNGQ